MKKVTKFFMAALLAGICSFGYGQDYLNPPKSGEIVLSTITVQAKQGYGGHYLHEWYAMLLEEASNKYPGKNIDIRGIVVGAKGCSECTWYKGPAIGKIVDLDGSPESQSMESLSKAMDKALRNVREGSRVAIDMVTVSGGVSINREDLKDQIIDALLDKGYKVVAKDYLDKLYEEQQAQQSGIYNDNTTVQDNNFSAVGYYINVKVTETSLRVQVVNVSTGEYEGNATVNF